MKHPRALHTDRVKTRLVVAFLFICAVLLPQAARAAVTISVDIPAANATIRQPFALSGWAIDTASTTGTGIDVVDVWAFPTSGAQPVYVGRAPFGARPDVAALYGSQFQNSGYGIMVRGLKPMAYNFQVFAYSTVAGAWSSSALIPINVLNDPHMNIDAPANGATITQPYLVSGWAIDAAAISGTGVSDIHLWAIPTDGTSAVFVGNAVQTGSYGGARSDIGAAYGSQFTPSGWGVPLSGLTQNKEYDLVAYMWSDVLGGFTLSQSRRVTIAPTVPTPTIVAGVAMPNGAGDLYISAEITSIPGATIRFTRDGSTPTETSELYTSPLSLTVNTSLRARAFKPDWSASGTAAQEFTVPLHAPEISEGSGVYQTPLVVHITGPSGAAVHFTRDGSTPSVSSETYTAPFQVAEATVLRVQAFKSGNAPSAVASADYTFQVPEPTITTAGGAYAVPVTINITVPSGSAVRFTRDGSTPSETSELYTGGIPITLNTSLRARAFRSGWTSSSTVSAEYTVAVAAPAILTAGGVYTAPLTTEISGPIGAEVRITRDGSAPTQSSELYGAPVQISVNTQLRAQAFKTGNAPSAVASADYTLQVALPSILTTGGAYDGPLTALIDVPVGTEVRFTRDGSTPSDTSELYATGGVQVTANTSLRARAFKPGWTASGTVSADYTVATAVPTILTGGGLYEAPVMVEITVPTGATVRLTRDGSTPTNTSEEYVGPFEIAQNTQLRAVAFKSGMGPSASASADYTFAAATPVFNLQGGSYAGSISVMISTSTPGASLYWTDDGSDPSVSSSAYTGPIVLGAGLTKTIKARAVRTGWDDSPVATVDYTTQLVGPVTISAHTWPKPNSAGWNNTDVTVSFTCTNAVTCPGPVTLSTEGIGQVVAGMASNADHMASTTVTINIDRTPPTVSLPTSLPPSAAGDLALSGSSNDALSGLDTVGCNGTSGTFAGGTVTCTVTLRYGLNAIVMQATDLAGNTNASGTQVTASGTPSSLAISPSKRTLTVGDSVMLQVRDDGDGVPGSITWTSNNGLVAAVDVDGLLTANTVGQAIITATSGSLSAEATINVLPSGPIPVGTVSWSVDVPSGYEPGDVVVVRSSDETSFAKIESRFDEAAGEWGTYTNTRIVGLTSSGEPTFVLNAGLGLGEHVLHAMGDSDDGVLLVVKKEPTTSAERDSYRDHGGSPISLVRVGLPGETTGWRRSLGLEFDGPIVGSLAQAADGTIYGVETAGTQLFGLDGATGLTKFHGILPSSVFHFYSAECPQLDHDETFPAKITSPKIDQSGAATFVVTTQESTIAYSVLPQTCTISALSIESKTVAVRSYRVDAQGTPVVTELSRYAAPAGIDLGDTGFASTLPGDDGGVLATWGWCANPNGGVPVCEMHGRYVVNGTPGPEYSMDFQYGAAPDRPMISGFGRVGYRGSGAIDLLTGTSVWSKPVDPYSQPTAALEDGKVLYSSMTNAPSTVYGPDGSAITSVEPTFFGVNGEGTASFGPLAIFANRRYGSLSNGGFGQVIGLQLYMDGLAAYPFPEGGPQKAATEPDCTPPLFDRAPHDMSQARDYSFAFSDEYPPTTDTVKLTDGQKALFGSAFDQWKFGGDYGFPKVIRPWKSPDATPPNVILGIYAQTRPQDLDVKIAIAQALYPESMYEPLRGFTGPQVSQLLRLVATKSKLPPDKFGIYINRNLPTATAEDKSYFSFAMAHEFGHVIGIRHAPQGCSYKTSIMVEGVVYGMPHVTEPTELDKAALRKLLHIVKP